MPNRHKVRAERREEAAKDRRSHAAQATSSVLRMSGTKVRRVAELINGKTIDAALAIVDFLPQRGAPEIKKVLVAAASNGDVEGLDKDSLVVSNVQVNEGFTLRGRVRPRAQGRAFRIRRRTCRVTIVVEEREE